MEHAPADRQRFDEIIAELTTMYAGDKRKLAEVNLFAEGMYNIDFSRLDERTQRILTGMTPAHPLDME